MKNTTTTFSTSPAASLSPPPPGEEATTTEERERLLFSAESLREADGDDDDEVASSSPARLGGMLTLRSRGLKERKDASSGESRSPLCVETREETSTTVGCAVCVFYDLDS